MLDFLTKDLKMSGVRTDANRQVADAISALRDYEIEIFECRNSRQF